MGFFPGTWEEQLDNPSRGSHEVKALITIAQGNERRHVGEVYEEIRLREGLTAQRNSNTVILGKK